MVENTGCSSSGHWKGPRFRPQHLHGRSPLSITLVPEVPTPYWPLVPGTHGSQTHACKAPICIENFKNVYLSKLVLDMDLLNTFYDGGLCWVACHTGKSGSASVQQCI